MRRTFLEYVAEDLLKKFGNDMSRIKVVFPNKRASLFLNDYLVRCSDKPIWSPTYLTISQLFRSHSDLIVGDDIQLICYLHHIYQKCTGINETLDHFYGWGQLLLSDFDDIDKNLADAVDIFRNISNIHELDDISYLTEEQKLILKKFFHNFSEEYNTELKKRFLKLWRNFGKIYQSYNELLYSKGLAYEGSLYRKVAINDDIEFDAECYIFIGFNMLQKVEQKIFNRLQKQNKAKFYWDFDHYYLNDEKSEAGYYIRQYLTLFPNELNNKDVEIYDNFSQPKDITYISASTETMQARYVSHWLMKNKIYEHGRKTAVVLCDENLLHTAIYSLPPVMEHVNITTGFPLAQSPIFSFINSLITLQTTGYIKRKNKFRLRMVASVLRHPYTKYLSRLNSILLSNLEKHHTYYPSKVQLAKDESLEVIFTCIDFNTNSRHDYNIRIISWLLDIIKQLGIKVNMSEDVLMKESIFKMYMLLNRISELLISGDLQVDFITLQRLLYQLIKQSSIPFHGEPAIGVQLMGVLETRNIDFEHVLLLSCNEGNMPKGIQDSSFIPYSIRKTFDLTTIDHKTSIYSYYFHRLLQRAKSITILYNNSRSEGHTNEMSRFMMQMLVESNQNIKRESIQAGQTTRISRPKVIEKNEEIMTYLRSLEKLSPTAINRYLRCPVQFYYYTIAKIKELDNEDGKLDNRIFGNIFHRSAQLIYSRLQSNSALITKEVIKQVLSSEAILQQVVDQAFREEFFKVEQTDSMPEYNGLQLINKKVIIRYLQQLLKIDERLAPFQIKGMEEEVTTNIEFDINEEYYRIQIGGFVDRIDEIISDGKRIVRVIDYKTGHATQIVVQELAEVFDEKFIVSKHTDYYLQTILYSAIIRHSVQWNKDNLPVSPGLLFIQKASDDDFNPILLLGKERINDIILFENEFWDKLYNLLKEIFNKNIPFSPTSDRKRCANCIYARLCNL